MVKRTSLTILFLIAFLIIPFISLNSYAEESGVSSGVTMGDPSSKGSSGIGVPIEVPPGRKGISPNLKLVYDSSQGYGWVGIGWDLSIGAIQRSVKRVVNYSANDYIFVGNGASELTSRSDWGTNYYEAKTEGAFNKFYYDSSTMGWVVTDKAGTKYYYGSTSASRQNNPFDSSNNNEIFKWFLDRVEDINGNFMTVSYVKDKEIVYMDRIDYTGNSNGLSPTNYVKFNCEDATLKNIEVYASGQLARKYVLDYIISSNSGRPLLSSVQTYGSDGITALPATTFSYQTSENGFSDATLVFSGSGNVTNSIGIGDFNGDGKDDIAMAGVEGSVNVYLSNGNGFNGGSEWGGYYRNIYYRYYGVNKVYTGDFNGDGRDDLLVNASDANGEETAFYVFYSNGSSFSVPVKLSIAGNAVVAVGDFNGDGKADIARVGSDCWVYLSTGNGFIEELWLGVGYPQGIFRAYAKDLSGDGRADLVVEAPLQVSEPYGNIIYVHYSKGSSFTPKLGLDDTFGNISLGDFNGDGRADISRSIGQGKIVYTSRGIGFNSWIPWLEWTNSYVGTSGAYAGDFNGDGKDDLLVNGTDNGGWSKGIYVHYSTGPVADLLATINNGIGGTTTISYKPSTQYNNTYMPYVIQTVSSITNNDGNGNISTTHFTYSGGYYDINEREFRGFQYVKSTDPAGTTTETWFHQDNIYKGLSYEQITKDAYGNIYTRTYNTYNLTSPAAGVNFPYLSQKDDYVYDGAQTYRQTTTSFEYDSYGNTTRKYLFGNTSVSGDETDGYTTYNYDTTNWKVSLPSHVYVNDSSGTTKSQTWFAYDTKGNLLTKTHWLNGGTNPAVTYAYDAYGNQISMTDAKGSTATIAYDSTYTYPVAITNALGHTAAKTYDLRYGKALTETDANGNIMTYEYDVFGRISKATNPLDIYSAYGTTSYSYENFGSVGNQRVTTYSTEYANTTASQSNSTCPSRGYI